MITAMFSRETEDAFSFWFPEDCEWLTLDELKKSVPDPSVLQSLLSLPVGKNVFVTLGILAIEED